VLRIHYPVPVIVCGYEQAVSGPLACQAVEAGAFEIVCKPPARSHRSFHNFARQIGRHIRAAQFSQPVVPSPTLRTKQQGVAACSAVANPSDYLVAIGASTGGTEAIRQVLAGVPAEFPPVVMVQHMPVDFTRTFAARLDRFSALEVGQATDGQPLRSGLALLARGDTQMTVERGSAGWVVRYGSQKPYNRHCPSVDVLFNSVAEVAGAAGVGILLTGMGNDGAAGLLKMREAGARTFVQNRESCVVYGMPKVAVEIGAAEHIAAPDEIPQLVVNALAPGKRRKIASLRK
jgi:two-component system chemotaxis response regulator CheB